MPQSSLGRAGSSRWRASSSLCGALVMVTLLHGGCSIDDRVLSDAELGGSGGSSGPGGESCGAEPTNACEACLYERCCDETRACGPGSECLAYLACADACDGNEGCLDSCGTRSPRGLLDALDLGVCSQRECPACAAQRDAAFSNCDPNGLGACQSSSDCSALEGGALDEFDVEACPECETLSSLECVQCLSERTGLSEGCSGCVADWLSCAVLECSLDCDVAADEAACQSCLSEAGCTPQLGSCGFAR